MMTASEYQPLLEQILHAIEHNDIVLPTLPEVAIKIQDLINNPNVSADQIVYVLSGDPFISVQIIKAANSAVFADKPRVDRVRDAATRLGYSQLSNLVMTIAMSKMFCSKNPVINQQMKTVWDHSREVAAVSYVLASRQPHLSPDQAMLAGLIHDIGILPLCMHIEKNHIPIGEDTLNQLIQKCHATIGTKLLKKWNFPRNFIEVIGEHENLHRDSSDMPRADYADVVCIANLQCSARPKIEDWDKIAAAKRLGLNNEECQTYLERNAERIALVAGMLGIEPRN
jgi:putative nucleotidyltransferase with HDIG domain